MVVLLHHLQCADRAVVNTDTALNTYNRAGIGMEFDPPVRANVNTDSTGITFFRIYPDRSVHFGDCPFRTSLQAWTLLTLNTDGH